MDKLTMNIVSIISILSAILFSSVALWLFKGKSKVPEKKFFAFFCLMLAAWSITTLAGILDIQESARTLFLIRLTMSTAVLLSLSFFLFASTYAKNIKLHRALAAVASIVVFIFCYTPLVFKSLEVTNGTVLPVPGAGMPAFALVVVALITAAFFLLLKHLKTLEGLERKKWLLLIVALFIMFTLMLGLSFAAPVVFKSLLFLPLAPLFILPALLVSVINLTNYGLFGTGVAFSKTVLTVTCVAFALFILFIAPS